MFALLIKKLVFVFFAGLLWAGLTEQLQPQRQEILISNLTDKPSAATNTEGLYNSEWPPERFRPNPLTGAAAEIYFFGQEGVDAVCGKSPWPYHKIACSNQTSKVIIMPDPCLAPENDEYAKIVCHELAHLAGWPATHGV